MIWNYLKKRILEDGNVFGEDVLKVDSFLNHQIDVKLLNEIGKEFKRRFENKEITKILTIEASGIGIACIAAQYFNVPVVFAKKHQGSNMDENTYESEVFSFTKNKSYKVRVSKKYINTEDKVLIIDDFLANGNAACGLIDIVREANGEVQGVGIVIEKGFQNGRKTIEDKGVTVESLAIVESMKNGKVIFKN
ncbi:xanthine phosphoribosyltransferase [Clostridium novyi A str. BKT29909]|uniref:xanthine phosphoribosyltransferase n=1 Tax=Clostridium novyi TaxID=1542 RepID=UPI0004DACCA4|nr:xanthine phosphoribosyltransferase [Clostridium novyi]KEH90324.1 xanthine phosphoribosyltransferase [Clostridium novyi A str. BKT29909]